ncbi:MAG: methyl-accepting chemotaxis protein [Candidatus Eisenbacteria bacterium]
MKWTVRTRLIGLGALGIVLLLTVGVTGSLTLRQAVQANAVMATYGQAARNHLEIDMMHDALHSDALTIATARDAAEVAEITTNTQDHIANVRKFQELNAALPLSPEIMAMTAEIHPMFERYIGMIEDLDKLAARGDRAGVNAAMPAFVAQFESMEGPQEKGSEMIAEASRKAAENVDRAARNGQLAMLIMSVLAVLTLLFAANRVTRSITAPLDETVRIMDAVAGGNLDARSNLHSDDELGRLGAAVNHAMESLSRTLSGIARNAVAVGQSSELLTTVSHELSQNAHETSSRSQQASAASEEVDASVRMVTTSSQEVGASIREVAQNTNEAVAVAGTAVRLAGEANATVRQLGESSEQIDNVIRVISSIAEQTNILALNAEIEAARAGDAGKGFSVVANEVKDLAKETARATEDIARRVSAIRSDSRAAVQAISEIVGIIDRISATQTSIAKSVQEQNAATAEIARSMTDASSGTSEIASNIAALAETAERGSSAARETQRAAEDLSTRAAELQRLVGEFRFTATPDSGQGNVGRGAAGAESWRRAA